MDAEVSKCSWTDATHDLGFKKSVRPLSLAKRAFRSRTRIILIVQYHHATGALCSFGITLRLERFTPAYA
jgi:hypothetical protein